VFLHLYSLSFSTSLTARPISWLIEGKKALVVVNPFGGSRNGIRIYEDILVPMFNIVEIRMIRSFYCFVL
jgi:hypothetical protein